MRAPSRDPRDTPFDPSALEALKREAHVYLARPLEIDDPDRLAAYGALLDAHERAREARLNSDALRRMYRIAHALVRTTLSRYADVAPSAWSFREGEHGRPEIATPAPGSDLRFNLSHTRGLVACVVCRDVACGVDVERVGRVRELERVARRVFCEPEIADIEARSEASQHDRFAEYWVLKEAYVKARGMGFRLPLRDIRFTIHSQDAIDVGFADDFGDHSDAWQIALRTPAPGDAAFRLGIALRRDGGPSRTIVVREVVP